MEQHEEGSGLRFEHAPATSVGQRICKTHIFDETFRVNRVFNSEVFVAAPHPVAMEFNLFGERAEWSWV
jgi:hypothetical protein